MTAFDDYYAADDECMAALAANDLEAHHRAAMKMHYALRAIMPFSVTFSDWNCPEDTVYDEEETNGS